MWQHKYCPPWSDQSSSQLIMSDNGEDTQERVKKKRSTMILSLCTKLLTICVPEPGGNWLFIFLLKNPWRISPGWICPAHFWTHMNCSICKLALENSYAAYKGVVWRSPFFSLFWAHDFLVSFEVPRCCPGGDTEFLLYLSMFPSCFPFHSCTTLFFFLVCHTSVWFSSLYTCRIIKIRVMAAKPWRGCAFCDYRSFYVKT